MPSDTDYKSDDAQLDIDPAEAKMVKRLLQFVESMPSDVEEELERAAGQRAYFKDCMLRPAQNQNTQPVTTNYVYRYTSASVNDILATEPTCNISMRDKLWGPGGPPAEMMAYGDTLERLANFMGDMGDFASAMHEVAWDASTVPLGFIKVIWTEDYHRDPLGARLHGPQRMNATYRMLHAAYKAGEFDDEDDKYLELMNLSESLKPIAHEQVNGVVLAEGGVIDDAHPLFSAAEALSGEGLVNPKYLPDVPLFQKFDFEVIDFEDVRWDWKIESLRHWWDQDYIGHRVPMSSEDLITKYDLSEEQQKALRMTKAADESDETYERREEIKCNQSENTVDVWEIQDQETMRVYVVSSAYPGILDMYEPNVTWSKFFTIFPLSLNPTPDGLIGLSDVDIMRPLQDEINEIRTNKKLAVKAKLPRWGYPAHIATDDGGLDDLQAAPPFSMTKLGLQTDKLKDDLFEFSAGGFDPGILNDNLTYATTELQAMGGRPLSALGAAQKGVTATQTAFSSSQLGEMISARRVVTSRFMSDIYTCMLEILMQTLDETQVRAIVGPAAVWPPEGREAIFMNMNVKVTSFLDGEEDSQRFLANFQTFMMIAQAAGVMPDPKILADIAKEYLGLDVPIEKWFPIPAPMPMGGAGTPGPAQGSPANAPNSAAPSADSLPGNAQTAQGVAAAALQ